MAQLPSHRGGVHHCQGTVSRLEAQWYDHISPAPQQLAKSTDVESADTELRALAVAGLPGTNFWCHPGCWLAQGRWQSRRLQALDSEYHERHRPLHQCDTISCTVVPGFTKSVILLAPRPAVHSDTTHTSPPPSMQHRRDRRAHLPLVLQVRAMLP
jgi:hypothetical protein